MGNPDAIQAGLTGSWRRARVIPPPPVHGSGETWAPAVIFRNSEPGGGGVANKRTERRSTSFEGSVACYGHGRLARTMPAAKGRRDKKVMYIIRNMVFGPLRRPIPPRGDEVGAGEATSRVKTHRFGPRSFSPSSSSSSVFGMLRPPCIPQPSAGWLGQLGNRRCGKRLFNDRDLHRITERTGRVVRDRE